MIVITALLLGLILLSTAIYVIETEKAVPAARNGLGNSFSAYEQSIRRTLISALSNVSGGGNTGVLAIDLSELNSAIVSHSYQAIVQVDYTPLNVTPYQNGFWISWGTNGHGISSVCSSFALNSSGFSSNSNLEYAVNVTTELNVIGNYLQFNDSSKQVNLRVNMLNEGKPALAQNLTIYFENATKWTKVEAPLLNSLGNGTYTASFSVETVQLENSLLVSVNCQDKRGITVGANVTCNFTNQ
jgi:hypothetical protein